MNRINRIAARVACVACAVLTAACNAPKEAPASVPVPAEGVPYAQIANVGARSSWSLDGAWKTVVDLYETGYYDYRRAPLPEENTFFREDGFYDDPTRLVEVDFRDAPTLQVPGDWNTQRKDLYYYEGSVWYRRGFSIPRQEGKRYFLYFEGANYETVVGLNGKVLGKHVGGFTPFNFEITSGLRDGENTVTAMVSNKRRLENVPTINFDWWNYGGLTRSVCVVETPETFIRDYSLQLKKGEMKTLSGWVQLDGSKLQQQVFVEIPELGLKQELATDASGYAAFEVAAEPELWSPEHPKLYAVNFVGETDSVCDRIGFRCIEARGNAIFLNGHQVFLRGISVHEEQPLDAGGRAYSADQARQTLQWVKEMNGNFVRLAHYPHNEAMIRMAEEMGIMVWSEIPVYWTIAWDNPETYANALNQLTENITRDRNRCNVVIWSVANETPLGDARLKFLSGLVDKAHELDPTRLVSAAMEKEYINEEQALLTVVDPLAEKVDLMSFNQYVGWYDGDSDKCDRVTWTFDIQKPVFISEFGGGALAGRHGGRNERFTEEYQEYMYQKNVEMLSRIPGLSGATPWILKDFRSPKRMLVGIQDDYNRKGLVSEFGEKKKAFYVMRDWYARLSEEYANK